MSHPTSGKHQARIALSAVGVLVVIAAAGCAHAASHHPAAPSTNAVPASTGSTPSGPAITPPPTSNGQAAAVLTWYAGSGGQSLSKVGSAMSAFASSTGNLAAEISACQAIGNAVTAAQAAPPFPLATPERWYLKALAHYGQGAADCQAGASGMSPSVILQAAKQFDIGNTYLSRVTAAINKLSGQ
jgi:hypothetical protein